MKLSISAAISTRLLTLEASALTYRLWRLPRQSVLIDLLTHASKGIWAAAIPVTPFEEVTVSARTSNLQGAVLSKSVGGVTRHLKANQIFHPLEPRTLRATVAYQF